MTHQASSAHVATMQLIPLSEPPLAASICRGYLGHVLFVLCCISPQICPRRPKIRCNMRFMQSELMHYEKMYCTTYTTKQHTTLHLLLTWPFLSVPVPNIKMPSTAPSPVCCTALSILTLATTTRGPRRARWTPRSGVHY